MGEPGFSDVENDKSRIHMNGGYLDDERVAGLITVITSTSPIHALPSLRHIRPAQTSLFQVPALAKCRKIIG